MRDISRIMARTIASLDCSSQAQNEMVKLIVKHKELEIEFHSYDSLSYKRLNELAKQFTVKDFLDAEDASLRIWLKEERQNSSWLLRLRIPRLSKEISRKLVKAELTQLDLILLPSATVTTQMLQRLGKKELLERSILMLSTLSSTALMAIQEYFKKHPFEITIRDFINTSKEMWDQHGTLKKSISKTRQRLLKIGLGYEDGIFLQESTKRQLVEDLVTKESLSHKTASKVIEIAQKRGWVSRAMI